MMSANEFYGMVHSANEKYFYKPDNHKPMKLQTTITQTKELDILLPLFYKQQGCGINYLAVLDEKTLIELFISMEGDMVTILHAVPEDRHSKDILKAMREWEAIKEQEFLSAYDDALSAISLRPKLNESFVDTLQSLDLKRNGG